MSRRPLAIAVVGAAALGLALAVSASGRRGARPLALTPPARPAAVAALIAAAPPSTEVSNIDDDAYVGPAACIECHPENGARWRAGLHATMTQVATRAAVVGRFDGALLRYGDGRARFDWRDDAPTMELTSGDGVTRRFKVTRTIGTRALQEYVGVAQDDPAGIEVRLPFGWWRARADWYPQPYYDSWFDAEWQGERLAFDPTAAALEPWADRCAWCHNTYPFALRAARPDVGVGPERDLAPMPPLITDNHLPIERLVTVGISCESCHFGGRAHAEAPEQVAPTFAPRGPKVIPVDDAPLPPTDRDDPQTIGAICAQCHSTPSPRFPDGSPARNSSESLALAAGACASAIRCVDCHDPHQRGPDAGGPDRAAHLAACARCHPALASPAAAQAHARHAPEDASCLDCHLPRLVQGIGTYVRSHRISSPGDRDMLAAGAPNACNLCHLDRSITWTARALADWGVTIAPRPAWRAAYGGDLDRAVGPIWLAHREAYVRMAAAAAYARVGDRAALPRLIEVLDDDHANTRTWILLAVEALAGRRLPVDLYDPLAPPAVRARQLVELRRWAAALARASARRP
ncbi:MAG: ammonia-forming cytochrome c nitrite reductase subunit c552 [Myxococcales bacterium]|nr:ammonia-forming cytochrome c nitrite reductase subunit c552 [Myxococcales bacterium]